MKRNTQTIRDEEKTALAQNRTLLLLTMICNILTFIFVTTLGLGALTTKGVDAPAGVQWAIVGLIAGSGYLCFVWIRKYIKARKHTS